MICDRIACMDGIPSNKCQLKTTGNWSHKLVRCSITPKEKRGLCICPTSEGFWTTALENNLSCREGIPCFKGGKKVCLVKIPETKVKYRDYMNCNMGYILEAHSSKQAPDQVWYKTNGNFVVGVIYDLFSKLEG